MCGIAGCIAFRERIDEEKINRMLNAIAHRGPNSEKIICKDKIAFAHARLAIVDKTETAIQPMFNIHENIMVSFNGEIYNSQELRKELQSRGYIFKTECSDTEVILNAYEEWNENFVDKINGMYAIAIADFRYHKAVLVRDRIGIKPLYYAFNESVFVFGSEIKSLHAYGISKKISSEAVYHYLTFLGTVLNKTMYENIYKVYPGEMIIIHDNKNIEKKIYWEPKTFLNDPLDLSDKQAHEIFNNLLYDSVKKNFNYIGKKMISLSGGTDSNLIAALAKSQGIDFDIICMDYDKNSKYSESEIALKNAKTLNVSNGIKCSVSKDYFLDATQRLMMNSTDVPIATPDMVLINIMSNTIKENGYDVYISGEGADELGGYPSYLKMLVETYNPNEHNLYKGKFISTRHVQSFFEEEKCRFWVGTKCTSSYEYILEEMNKISTSTKDEFIRKVQNVEFAHRLPNFMLPRVDYTSMDRAVEVRVPFLEHRLVEFLLQLNKKHMMDEKKVKIMISELLNKTNNQLEVKKKKLGFGKVMIPFLEETMNELFKEQVINRKNHPLYEFVDKKCLIEQLSKANDKQAFKIWNIYALAKWLEINMLD